MSKEKSSSPESAGTPSAKRRPAKSRSGKPAKPANTLQTSPADASVEKSAPAYPVFDSLEPSSGEAIPEAAASGESSPQEGAKRNKRRRKKGKGGASQAASAVASQEPGAEGVAPPPRPAREARPKLDPESVAKLAWKIYLAEVSEEGVALIGDSDAKELSHRCFRLAEIFMEEQSRRR